MFRKSLICIALFSSASANSTVCTDPAGLGQILSQTSQDMMMWAEEKGMKLTEFSLTELIAIQKETADTNRVLAQTQAISNTASNTANLNQQAKMEPSPLMCNGINSVVAIYESLDDFYCETSNSTAEFAAQLAQVSECVDGRCNTTEQSIADEAVELFEEDIVIGGEPDMSKLNVSGLLPGMGEAGYSKSPEEKERVDTLLKVMFNPGDVSKMPTEANGDMVSSSSSPQLIRLHNHWQRKFLRTTAGYNTAVRVSGLSDPRDENGQKIQSLLEQVKSDIDFYNSPEQIKLIGNGGDKSCFRLKAALLKTQKEMDLWLESPQGIECKKSFTTVEQVHRINAQMSARIMALLGNIYDSSLSSEMNAAIQTQILNEILNKRGQ